MEEVCGLCKTWRQQQSWNNKHQFYKIMIGAFWKRLRIPQKFISEFKGKLSQKVTLRGPSGNNWTAVLAQTEKDFVLQNGWPNFVKDHSLNDGDFLVFKYIEDSLFEVLIFDTTGCEREDSHFVEPDANSCCSSRHNNKPQASTTIDEGQIKFRKRKRNSVVSVDQYPLKNQAKKKMNGKGMKLEKDEEESDSINKELPRKDTLKHETRKRTKHSKQKYPMFYESGRRTITKEDGHRAFDLASKRSTKNPFCKITMKPTHVEYLFTLTMPKEFADNCLPMESQKIRLRVGSKTWPVTLNRRGVQSTLNYKGWAQFVFDNNLETGDICVLEPADTGTWNQPITLDVHIFRVVEHIVPLKVVKPLLAGACVDSKTSN